MFARVNGIDLHYTVEGGGFPCLVPRALNTSVTERTLSPRLREQIQLIFFDFRGSGRSGGAPGDFTLDQLLADIDGLRLALGHERVGFFGWSILSLVGIDFALAYPDSLARLILVGAIPRVGDADDSYWETLASPARKARLAENQARLDQAALAALPPGRAMTLRYAANGPRYWYDPTFDCAPLYADDEWDLTCWEGLQRELGPRHRDTSTVAGVATPTFLAQGVWDFVCPPVRWREVLPTFRDCTYHAFERSGHYPFYEERDTFDAALLAWLAAPRPGPR